MTGEDDDFSQLFDRLPIGAYRSTPDGRQLRVNLALARMDGFASVAEHRAGVVDAAVAGRWYVQPNRRAEFIAALDREGEVQGFVSEVHRFRTRERIWVRENAYAVRNNQGQVLYYEGTVEEVTAQVRSEEALRRSEEGLRQIAAQVPGALYRIRLEEDERQVLDYISDGVRALFGVSPQQAMDDIDLLARLRHPDDRERVLAEIGARNLHNQPLQVEYRVVLPDGNVKWIQQASSLATVDPRGHRLRVGLLLDITQRKEAEAALQASELRWKLALESAGDGVWDWDIVANKGVLSPRCLQMYGFEPDEPPNRYETLDELTHPEDVPAMLQAREDHFAGRAPAYVNEHRVRCKDGRWIWVLSRGMVIERSAAGQPLRMIGTHTDITERREAEALRLARDRAESAQRATTAFLSRVSHELRTPLNAILGFAQLLQMETGGASPARLDERRSGFVQQILDSGQHLLALVNDILDLSSVQSGQQPLRPETLALRPVVEEAWSMLAGSALDAGVTLIDEVADQPAVLVRADRQRLRQVVANLLSNAIKYNRRGGWVRLGAQHTGDGHVQLAVVDSGVGIDPQQLPRLFQPFERLGAQRSSVSGTGLGLALSRQLAEAMGGSITVISEPQQGSVFTLTLPAG